MKKLILIPTLAIASTLPALCAVSCGTATRKWSLGDGEFKWTHGLASGSVNSEEEATNRYFNEIDKKLLADDLIKQQIDKINKERAKYIEASIVIKVTNIDKEEHRLTFSLHSKSIKEKYSNELHTSDNYFVFVNFPMELSFDGVFKGYNWILSTLSDDEPLHESVMPKVYRDDPKWSFTCDANVDGNTISGTINSKTEETPETIDIMEACFSTNVLSYYFKNVELK